MSVEETTPIELALTFNQGDARDPLGVWGLRNGIAGDGSGGHMKTFGEVPAGNAGTVFTCYDAQVTQTLGGITNGTLIKCRLLTNWPNIDPQAGVQAYSSFIVDEGLGSTALSPPFFGTDKLLIGPNQRFLLMYDPRPQTGPFNIIELEIALNGVGLTFSFEAWGYYWDRAAMDAPGGPRHPGAN